MNYKYLNVLSFAISASAFCADISTLPEAWRQSHYGACYNSVEQGMAAVYGAAYQSDENVTKEKLNFGKIELITSSDRTAGTNSARTVFEHRNNEFWCVVLTSPPVATIVPIIPKGRALRPIKWETRTQAEPGFSELKVVYTWNAAKALYFPTRCFHLSGKFAERFTCRDAYK